MRKVLRALAVIGACGTLALMGCPVQPAYPTTITPIYAATSTGSLLVWNGSAWTQHQPSGFTSLSSVAVLGSGSGARVFVGGDGGVSVFNGSGFTAISGTGPVNALLIGSSLYAATSTGVSVLNADGKTWTSDLTSGSSNGIFPIGPFTYVASDTGLWQFNGTGLVGAPGPTDTPAQVVAGSTTVTAVIVDGSLDVFAGTDKGLAIGTGSPMTFGANQLPPNTRVNGLAFDSNGNYYAAAAAGLYINGTIATGLSGPVLCVCVDGAGTIYAGTSTGLQVSTDGGGTWTTKLPSYQVNAVAVTAPLYSF